MQSDWSEGSLNWNNKIILPRDMDCARLITRLDVPFFFVNTHSPSPPPHPPKKKQPYPTLLHITWEFYSIKPICTNLYPLFSHVEKAYTANQNGVQLFHMWKYNQSTIA